MKLKKKLRRFINKHQQLSQFFKNLLIIILVIFAGAIGVLMFEFQNSGTEIKNFFDSLWWALVTITTVGYGDVVPVTFWGRIIGIIFILLGFIMFSTFTAFIASAFIDTKLKEMKGLNKIKFRNHIIICGWNNSANQILDFLNQVKVDIIPNIVLINELDEGQISSLQNHYQELQIGYIKGDFTNQDILVKANIAKAKHIILLLDNSKPNSEPSDERTIIAAHNIAYMKLKGKISIQLQEEKYLPNIRRDKIQNVVIFDNLGGNILANSTMNPAIPDFIQEILNNKEGKGIEEKEIPYEFINKPYSELVDYFRDENNLIILGIVSVYTEVSIDKLVSDDTSSIDRFIKQQFELSGKKLESDKAQNNVKVKPDDNYIIQENDKAIII